MSGWFEVFRRTAPAYSTCSLKMARQARARQMVNRAEGTLFAVTASSRRNGVIRITRTFRNGHAAFVYIVELLERRGFRIDRFLVRADRSGGHGPEHPAQTHREPS